MTRRGTVRSPRGVGCTLGGGPVAAAASASDVGAFRFERFAPGVGSALSAASSEGLVRLGVCAGFAAGTRAGRCVRLGTVRFPPGVELTLGGEGATAASSVVVGCLRVRVRFAPGDGSARSSAESCERDRLPCSEGAGTSGASSDKTDGGCDGGTSTSGRASAACGC